MVAQVSVVIPARNDGAGLTGAVESVLGQEGVDVVEVLICVGPSSDDTATVAHDLARRHEVVFALDNPSGGISAALNVGLSQIRTDILVRVDARCRLAPKYISTALEAMSATGAANVGAVQVPVGHGAVQRAIAHAMAHPLGSGGAAYRAGRARQPVDTAFLGVFDTSALREIGGWDVSFARNEDAELNRRLIDAGHEVWLEPSLRVDYQPRTTLRALARQYFDYGWWRRRMIARHRTVRLRQLAPPIIVLGLSAGIVLAATVSRRFLVVPVGYLVVLTSAAARVPAPAGAGDRVLVAAALATMHLSWGAGFLASLVRGPARIPAFASSSPSTADR